MLAFSPPLLWFENVCNFCYFKRFIKISTQGLYKRSSQSITVWDWIPKRTQYKSSSTSRWANSVVQNLSYIVHDRLTKLFVSYLKSFKASFKTCYLFFGKFNHIFNFLPWI